MWKSGCRWHSTDYSRSGKGEACRERTRADGPSIGRCAARRIHLRTVCLPHRPIRYAGRSDDQRCRRCAATRCVEELPHGRRTEGSAWKQGDAQAFQHEAQHTLVLIESGRLISELGERWADQRADYAASAVGVSLLDSSKTMMSKPSFWKTEFLIRGSMLFLSQLSAVPRPQSWASSQPLGAMKE